jgi:hypothetical protein
MNWFIDYLIKEARGRRYDVDDRVRFFTRGLKGKGQGVVLTPSFSKGRIVDFDGESRRYRIQNENEEILEVHPRNIVPDSVGRSAPSVPVISEPILEAPIPEM